MRKFAVAIDGPAGAGKSTVARRIADRIGAIYIDTGAMYRAVALWALRAGIDLDDFLRLETLAREAEIRFTPGTRQVELNGEDVTSKIRTPEVTAASSRVAAVPGVRKAMVAKQQELAAHASVVMEGRDIGTVVLPDAKVKIFLDADPGIRARRRADEMNAKGAPGELNEVVRDMADRDRRDSERAVSPLLQAPDALYLDSTGLSIEEVEERILTEVRKRTSNGLEKTA